MKKVLVVLSLLVGCNFVFANPNPYDVIYNEYQAVYTPSENTWSAGGLADDRIVFTKEVVEGAGSYSRYNYEDGSLAFALSTDCEIIKDGNLIVVDNNLLRYYRIIYDNGSFEQVPMSAEEVQQIFPDAELFKVSNIDNDGKTWLHKPLLKKKTILLFNDTDRFFHKITCKSKNAQDSDIKGLITFSRYGIYRFKHFGKHKGELVFYIR